jgi:hypothetical protein
MGVPNVANVIGYNGEKKSAYHHENIRTKLCLFDLIAIMP